MPRPSPLCQAAAALGPPSCLTSRPLGEEGEVGNGNAWPITGELAIVSANDVYDFPNVKLNNPIVESLILTTVVDLY